MYITHVSPLGKKKGVLTRLLFLCTEHPDSIIYQIGFQQDQVLTSFDVQERVDEGLYVPLESPVRIDSEERVPWLMPDGNVWLANKTDPGADLGFKIIGFIH